MLPHKPVCIVERSQLNQLERNKKDNENQNQKRAKSVFIEHKSLRIQYNQHDNVSLPLRIKGETNALFKTPNALAATTGIHEAILLTMIQNGQKKKPQNIVLTGNPNIDMVMKLACYSSKLIRPFFGDLKTVNKVSDRAEVMRDKTNMTTTLREKVKDTFLVYALLNSKQVQLKELYKNITTQFGLLKENSIKHLQAYGFFSNTYYYFRGGAVAECEDFGIFKKMQQHHKLSKQLIKYVPGNDFVVDLVCNPNISLYSLQEEIGVNRIINYSSICGLCGLVPQTYNLNEDIVDMDGTNYIIDVNEVKMKQVQNTINDAIMKTMQKAQLTQQAENFIYVIKPSFLNVLVSEQLVDPELEDVNGSLAKKIIKYKEGQVVKLNSKSFLFAENSSLEQKLKQYQLAYKLGSELKTVVLTFQDVSFIQNYKNKQKEQEQVCFPINKKESLQYLQPLQLTSNLQQDSKILVNICRNRTDNIAQEKMKTYKQKYPHSDYKQQNNDLQKHPNVEKVPPFQFENSSKLMKENQVQHILCPEVDVESLQDFFDYQDIIINDQMIEYIVLINIQKYSKKQHVLKSDLQKIFENIDIVILIQVFNEFRHCNIKSDQCTKINIIQFLRKCFVDGMRRLLAEKLNLKMTSGLQTKEVLEILMCAPELEQLLGKQAYPVILEILYKNLHFDKDNNDDILCTFGQQQEYVDQMKCLQQQGIKCVDNCVNKIEDFIDYQNSIINDKQFVVMILPIITKCIDKQNLLCDDIKDLQAELTMYLLIKVYNSFRGCNIQYTQVTKIQPILFLRRCFVEGMKKELLLQVNNKSKCGLQSLEVLSIIFYSVELQQKLDQQKYCEVQKQVTKINIKCNIFMEKMENKLISPFNDFINGIQFKNISLQDVRKVTEEGAALIKMYKVIPQKKAIQNDYIIMMKIINDIYALLEQHQQRIRGFIMTAEGNRILQFCKIVMGELNNKESLILKDDQLFLMISIWFNGYKLVDFTDGKTINLSEVDEKKFNISLNTKNSTQFQASRLALIDEKNNVIIKECIIGVGQSQPLKDMPNNIKQNISQLQDFIKNIKAESISIDQARVQCENALLYLSTIFIQNFQKQISKQPLSKMWQSILKHQNDLQQLLLTNQDRIRGFLVQADELHTMEFFKLVLSEIQNREFEAELLGQNERQDFLKLFFSAWFNEYKFADFVNKNIFEKEIVFEKEKQDRVEVTINKSKQLFQTSRLGVVDLSGAVVVKQCVIGVAEK